VHRRHILCVWLCVLLLFLALAQREQSKSKLSLLMWKLPYFSFFA
jgi:hypothetical protein